MGCQDGVVRLNNSCGDLKKYRVNIISYQPRDIRLKMFFKTGHTAVAMSDTSTQKSLMFYIKAKSKRAVSRVTKARISGLAILKR